MKRSNISYRSCQLASSAALVDGPSMIDREILTLIPVFDAILSEGSLSRAAERLGVTQPAVSHALGRLRKLTNDVLFENTGHGMRPTRRALEMADHVRAALIHANAAFARKKFEVAALMRTFVLDIGAGFDALIVPPLFEELSRVAPNVRLLVSNARGGDLLNELKHGETEIAFDFVANDSDGIRCEVLSQGEAVAFARADHPALADGLTEDLYFELSHVALVWARSSNQSAVTAELERSGRSRRIAVAVPTVMAVGAVAASSNLIGTTSAFVAQLLAKRFDLRTHRMPFLLPPIPIYQLWHARFDHDAEHGWLRSLIRDVAQRMSSG
jgi:DNA-binding transcriptional LysR family regulator